MAVYYKFKSARDYDSIAMDGPFISVGVLKEKIFESKHLGRGTDFDLVVTNAQTNEEYLEEEMLIPKNTSVLIRRVPGRPRLPIVTQQEPKVEIKVELNQVDKVDFLGADSSATNYHEDFEWDEFGNDLYSIPEAVPAQTSNTFTDVLPTTKADEDDKIKNLVDNSAFDWQRQGADSFGPGRGFGRGMGGRMGGRGFGMERKVPPQGYICYRCKTPGHFIQHCPTNGDPNFDIKRVRPPTGIPKSMLMATPDGSYALPSGAVAVLQPNEAAFEKEIEGLPSTRSVGDLPPEFHCPLCKEVMKDAVLTSKCCFKSFCDKCIRNHIMSKSMCVCGATNILADDLLPNKTLRDTINRILESGNSSAENAGSTYQVQDMESARCPPPRFPSPTTSAASKGELKSLHANQETPHVKELAEQGKAFSAPQPILEKLQIPKTINMSEATHDSVSVREAVSQGSVPVPEEEVQQKLAVGEPAKKKKKKKVRPANDYQWKPSQDFAPENYMMPMAPMAPSAFNPFWNGMQPGMDGFMGPYAGSMPFMGYGLGPLDMPFGGMMPQDPFAAQGCMFPNVPPHRDLSNFGMGMNVPPPVMSREEFEARKADLRRRRENERRCERNFPQDPRDREYGREVSSNLDVPPVKSKPKQGPETSSGGGHHHNNRHHRSDRSSSERPTQPPPPLRPSKHKSDHRDRSRSRERERDYENDHYNKHDRHHHRSETSTKHTSETAPPKSTTKTTTTTTTSAAAAAAEAAEMKRHKQSVFARISFPRGELKSKKHNISDTEAAGGSDHHHNNNNNHHHQHQSKKSSSSNGHYESKLPKSSNADYESSDDDRHFKRKPSRYEPSPPPPPPPPKHVTDREDEQPRHSRRSKDKNHDDHYDRYSKRR